MALKSSFPSSILIVEDNALIAMNLGDMLEGFGVDEVQIVTTVKDALAELESRVFELAFIDIQLGNESGFVVADACTEKDVPVIFSTGYGDIFRSAAYSNERVLNKPYTIADVRTALRTLTPVNAPHERGSPKKAEEL